MARRLLVEKLLDHRTAATTATPGPRSPTDLTAGARTLADGVPDILGRESMAVADDHFQSIG